MNKDQRDYEVMYKLYLGEKNKLKEAVAHIAKLTDFAIWLTGHGELTQYEHFVKNRYLLSVLPIYVETPSADSVVVPVETTEEMCEGGGSRVELPLK